jgi:hypothetical protein
MSLIPNPTHPADVWPGGELKGLKLVEGSLVDQAVGPSIAATRVLSFDMEEGEQG